MVQRLAIYGANRQHALQKSTGANGRPLAASPLFRAKVRSIFPIVCFIYLANSQGSETPVPRGRCSSLG